MAEREDLLPLYRRMFLIRRFEEEAARAYAQGKIGGFLHLYIGQEAVAVGADAALRTGDWVFQTYRDHGTALSRGTSARACMAELYGRDTGCSRGLGGSMHFFDVPHDFLGGYGIVGGHVALAAGAAFKAKYRREDRVAICFLGEGAINIGGFHEAASLAGLWKLPLVLVVENNTYAMGTPFSRSSPVEDITRKAQGYGMAGDRFDGHDVMLVRERLAGAIGRARGGAGPTLVEILTYRFRGHSMSDPGKYRTREELEERKRRDPVLLARTRLAELGVPETELAALDQGVEEEIADAVRFADESPPASADVMARSVHAPSLALSLPERT
jgi:pyruvate dehydrogenase E1 component alpha subunit